jgi:hypothetical protein
MTMRTPIDFVDDDISVAPGADLQSRRHSRRRAWRHGLAAQTVLETLENVRFYQTFERAFVSGFSPRSVIELELVYGLANLFWRLRRARAIETGLLDIQGKFLARGASVSNGAYHPDTSEDKTGSKDSRPERSSSPHDMAQCFIRLCDLGTSLDRVGTYESRLWRQAAQTIWILDTIRRPPTGPARQRFRKPLAHHSWDPCR